MNAVNGAVQVMYATLDEVSRELPEIIESLGDVL